jgi:hypothetical protein
MISPSKIEISGVSFYILETPTKYNVPYVAHELHKLNVGHLVRVCESFYDASAFESRGIEVHDMYFPAGVDPPKNVIASWNSLVKSVARKVKDEPHKNIAIH